MSNSDRVGVICHLATPKELAKVSTITKWVKLTLQQYIGNPSPGILDFRAFDESVNAARAQGMEIYASFVAAPAWEAPDLKPNPDGWVPVQRPEHIADLKTFVNAIVERYSEIKFWGVETEVNIPGREPFKNDGHGFWKMSPEDFANNVILPCAEVIHSHNKKVVSPGITIQRYEDGGKRFAIATDFMKRILKITKPALAVDHYCIHAYGYSVRKVHQGIVDFMKETGIGSVWVTETGVDELLPTPLLFEDPFEYFTMFFMTGEERQLRGYKYLLPSLELDPRIGKVFLYTYRDDNKQSHKSTAGLFQVKYLPVRGSDGKITDRIETLRLKPAGEYVRANLKQ